MRDQSSAKPLSSNKLAHDSLRLARTSVLRRLVFFVRLRFNRKLNRRHLNGFVYFSLDGLFCALCMSLERCQHLFITFAI